ncbi:uncharacterized protein EV422DRAFT_343893 [Fimicolochytrium jonesii]|uniref:uncharacterized protein n=1 Tax=Fimicolochytrium jonesii TaxID=1396493 RepID=UPI0022FDD233|nr:uncharacterized protein EV422DRAFT_343893 [Fimicolochytrium jonesii]KAI8815758.1 hypothetical protein EV422DRAFT_343893 [Fimicolochytrium jonesii]
MPRKFSPAGYPTGRDEVSWAQDAQSTEKGVGSGQQRYPLQHAMSHTAMPAELYTHPSAAGSGSAPWGSGYALKTQPRYAGGQSSESQGSTGGLGAQQSQQQPRPRQPTFQQQHQQQPSGGSFTDMTAPQPFTYSQPFPTQQQQQPAILRRGGTSSSSRKGSLASSLGIEASADPPSGNYQHHQYTQAPRGGGATNTPTGVLSSWLVGLGKDSGAEMILGRPGGNISGASGDAVAASPPAAARDTLTMEEQWSAPAGWGVGGQAQGQGQPEDPAGGGGGGGQ